MEHHAAVSLAISGLFYALTRSSALAVSSFAAGVLADLDHLVDFWITRGIRGDLRQIFQVCHSRRLRTAMLVFHSWELIVAGWLVAWHSGWNPWVSGAVLGLGHHVLFDQVSNRPVPWGYLLVWRILHKFDMAPMFPPERG